MCFIEFEQAEHNQLCMYVANRWYRSRGCAGTKEVDAEQVWCDGNEVSKLECLCSG